VKNGDDRIQNGDTKQIGGDPDDERSEKIKKNNGFKRTWSPYGGI
jgi:hypothetical protein